MPALNVTKKGSPRSLWKRHLAELVEHAREDARRRRRRLVREADDELFAAPAAAQVLEAEARRQQPTERHEHMVADQVAVRVVDALEPVDVDERDRERPRVPAGLRQAAGERVEERAPRHAPGERIALGRLAEQAAAVEPHAHAREELLGHQGLGEVVVGAGVERGDAALEIGASRQKEDRARRATRASRA